MVCSLTLTDHPMRKRTKHNVAKANRDLNMSLKNLQHYCISRRNVKNRCFVQLTTRILGVGTVKGSLTRDFRLQVFSCSVSPGPLSMSLVPYIIFFENSRVIVITGSLSRIFSDRRRR
jgi:hypothetical protein